MLKEMGVQYVIIGHSERRQYFGETDVTVNKRLKAALARGLKVILCVGETLEQREQGITAELVAMQTKIALGGVSKEDAANVYNRIRTGLGNRYGQDRNSRTGRGSLRNNHETSLPMYTTLMLPTATTIQYGGSMNAKNAAELLGKVDIDGGLIGGASLKAADFSIIVKAASK